jgi:hypothetical protein
VLYRSHSLAYSIQFKEKLQLFNILPFFAKDAEKTKEWRDMRHKRTIL